MNYFVHTVAVSLPISKVRNSKTKLDDPFLWMGFNCLKVRAS